MSRGPAEGAARARLAELLAREPVPLAEAALALALDEYPGLEPGPYLARLDALAARVRAAAGAGRAAGLLRALRQVLHDEEGLQGNTQDYYDPRNSWLNEVLDRRLGIPISLSVVTIEVAARAGLTLEGVGFPGHFLVRYAPPGGPEVLVDAFNGWELLSADEVLVRARGAVPGRQGQPLDTRSLQAAGPRQILARMLGNLQRIWEERKDDVRRWAALDLALVVAPGQLEALRERGLAAARLGAIAAARRDLEAYLAQAAKAEDAGEVRAVLDGLARAGGGFLLN
ncbi:MAG: transglutaminase-like domain-containing protein [Anaeromyxobacter sp.]